MRDMPHDSAGQPGAQIVKLLGCGTAADYSFLLGREPIAWATSALPPIATKGRTSIRFGDGPIGDCQLSTISHGPRWALADRYLGRMGPSTIHFHVEFAIPWIVGNFFAHPRRTLQLAIFLVQFDFSDDHAF